MATQVYLNVKIVVVAQAGTTTLNIKTDWSKYLVILPTSSVSGIDPLIPQYVRFLNTYTNEVRTSLISEVTDDLGNGFADLKALQDYLVFIPRSSAIKETKEEATAANQLLIIAQNTEIVDNTKDAAKGIEKVKEDTTNLENIDKRLDIISGHELID